MMEKLAPRTLRRNQTTTAILSIGLAAYFGIMTSPRAPAQTVAEEEQQQTPTPPPHSFFATTTVTATGTEIDTLNTPTPVTVIDLKTIEQRSPDIAVDLLRTEPGVDVNGIGPGQSRPIIRGMRGLRILLLEDGLRMNNPRRSIDFGEVTSLSDIGSLKTLEVVRGPASVLYGSDAIGGVINLITRTPPYAAGGASFGGSLMVRLSSVDEQKRSSLGLNGHRGKFSYLMNYTYRDAADYEAPSGSFGDITLDQDTRVYDTGVRDDNGNLQLGYRYSERHYTFLKYSRARIDETGFGYVDPVVLTGSEAFRLRIVYPYQNFDRVTFGYTGSALDGLLADTVNVKAYYQDNEREYVNDIDIKFRFFPGGPINTVEDDTLNYTDLETTGFRTEVTKLLGETNLVTYGADYTEDDSFNTDLRTEVTTFNLSDPVPYFGPCGLIPPYQCVFEETSDLSNTPNATNTAYGVFVQDEILLTDRFKVILGLRYANVTTRAEPTPGVPIAGADFEDDSLVGAVNGLFRVVDGFNLVASYGRAFRAPGIIERLFEGPTPQGSGFQVRNPDLVSEESDNLDVGFKFRRRNAFLEATYFESDIDNAIILSAVTAEEYARLPQETRARLEEALAQNPDLDIQQQKNLETLKTEGFEISGGLRLGNGISVRANYTHITAESIETAATVGDTFSDKVNLELRYERPGGRWWVEYWLRHNGEESDISVTDTPVGETYPAFTIHRLAGGATLFERDGLRHQVGVIVDNVTDELWAEFSNASFFRPQPKRNIVATYYLRF